MRIQRQLTNEELSHYQDIMNCLKDFENWKKPTRYVEVNSRDEAMRIARALNHFCGGSEVVRKFNTYRVGSMGYYFYIGS